MWDEQGRRPGERNCRQQVSGRAGGRWRWQQKTELDGVAYGPLGTTRHKSIRSLGLHSTHTLCRNYYCTAITDCRYVAVVIMWQHVPIQIGGRNKHRCTLLLEAIIPWNVTRWYLRLRLDVWRHGTSVSRKGKSWHFRWCQNAHKCCNGVSLNRESCSSGVAASPKHVGTTIIIITMHGDDATRNNEVLSCFKNIYYLCSGVSTMCKCVP